MSARTSLTPLLTVLLLTSAGFAQTASTKPPESRKHVQGDSDFPRPDIELPVPLGHDRPENGGLFLESIHMRVQEVPRTRALLPVPIAWQQEERYLPGRFIGGSHAYLCTEDKDYPCLYLKEKTRREKKGSKDNECSVLDNLKKLDLAHSAYQFAEFLRALHEPRWATLWYEFASELCPGSRIDQLAQQRSDELAKQPCQESNNKPEDTLVRRLQEGMGLWLNDHPSHPSADRIDERMEPNDDPNPNPVQVMLSITIADVPRGRFFKDAPHLKVLSAAKQAKLLERIQTLRDKGKAKVLAEPRLITPSSHQASFLQGGELAVSKPNEAGEIAVQFEEFGTRVTLLPSVLADGKIRLDFEPEVSRLDAASGTTIDGVVVPGRVTQRIHAAVEMKSGETVAVAGLPADNGANNFELLILVKAEVVKPETKEAELTRKLASHVSVNYIDEPLRNVLDDLQTRHGINILPDKVALDEALINLEMPISIRLDDVSLKSALNLILADAHLCCVIRDGSLVVTTEKFGRGRFIERAYSVSDLLDPKCLTKSPFCGTQWSDLAELLIRMIQGTIGPNTWEGAGGCGIVRFVPLANAILVKQTPDMQEQVADLLNALRRLKNAPESGDTEEAEPVAPNTKEPENPKPSASLRPPLPPIDGGIVGAMQTLYLDHVEKEKAHLTLTVIESSSETATPAGSQK